MDENLSLSNDSINLNEFNIADENHEVGEINMEGGEDEEGDDENYAWESDVDTYNWDPAEAAHESWDPTEAAHESWDSTEAARAPESWDSTEAAHAPESWDAAEAALASWDSEEAARAPTSAPLLVGKPVPPDEALDFEDQLVCDSQAWGSGGWDGDASPQDETLQLVAMPTPSRDAPRVKRPRLSWRRECELEDEAWRGPPRFPLCGWAARNADKTNTYCYDPILDNEATKDTRKKTKTL